MRVIKSDGCTTGPKDKEIEHYINLMRLQGLSSGNDDADRVHVLENISNLKPKRSGKFAGLVPKTSKQFKNSVSKVNRSF